MAKRWKLNSSELRVLVPLRSFACELLQAKKIPFPLSRLSEADQLWAKANLPKDPQALANEVDRLMLEKMKSSLLQVGGRRQGSRE